MTQIIQPPPFVERFQYKNCKQINDPVTRKRVYQTPDGETLPSVTTILSATKDMTELNKWRDRVGHEKAQQITTEAAAAGASIHPRGRSHGRLRGPRRALRRSRRKWFRGRNRTSRPASP